MKVKIKHFNGKLHDYLTEGKEYHLIRYKVVYDTYDIIDDVGNELSIRINDCALLNFGSWEIISE